MKQLLEYIIPNIVNHPEDVKIEESTENGLINISIQTNPEDVGRVIGKSGKVIKAIRQIARILAIKQGVRVNIDVLDSAERTVNTPSTETESWDAEQELTPTSTDLDTEGIDLE